MQKKDDTHPLRSIIVPLVIGGLIILGIMVGYGAAMNCLFTERIDQQGQFGDQYGALNTLFSGMAFIGLAVTIFYQSRDLRAQTNALNLQQDALQQQITEFKEQKEEMQRSAEAQEISNKIARIAIMLELCKLEVSLLAAKAEDANSRGRGSREFVNAEKIVGSIRDRVRELDDSLCSGDGDHSKSMR